ncbi:MAG: bisanhydrobacterioruberin hydratase [Halobacteria archaeon]|nr:bisanhydrobacterioruberin hydratase [Halobacteria archaeon]
MGSSFGRREVERRAERLVRENRFTIAVVFPLMGTVLLVASHERLLPEPLNFNPALILFGTFVMRLPLLVGLAPLVKRREFVGLVILASYTYVIEWVGVTTGFPYGEFTYEVSLGPMVLGGVPLGLPVFFFPLVLNSYLLVLLLKRFNNRVLHLLGVLGVVIAVDLVLDPGAVSLGFWEYAQGGAYYNVPLSNYMGWVLSGAVATVIIGLAFENFELRKRLEECEFMLDDLVSFVILWGTVNAYFGNWVPVVIATGIFGALIRTKRFNFDVFRRREVSKVIE